MLKQLSGMDTMFLYAESHRAPLEVGCLQIYDPSTAPKGAVRFKEILATFQQRIDRCDVFQQKLATVPLSLDHPYWVHDDDFDLEYHVRHISLPRPGDWQQLMAQIARLQARQLDHSKPLWMAHIIEGLDRVEGLEPGCFAMYMKIHHAAIDGVTGHEVQAALHDSKPYQADASSYEPSSGPGDGSSPSDWSLLARAPFNTALKLMKLGLGLTRALPGVLRFALASRSAPRTAVPLTVFNQGRVSPNRVFDGRFFDLVDFKAIRASQTGTTINDVALTVLGGALRHYLDAKDALPDESLLAGCPINVGSETDANEGRGNLLSMMMAPLHTEIEDPVQRLKAIRDGTRSAKGWVEKIGSRTMTEIPLHLPAPIAKSLFPLISQLALRAEALPFNTIVTNVAGVQRPVYLAGAQLIRILASGPIIDRSGIFHTVFSYDGRVSIGFTACREMLPDPEFYASCIDAAFDELKTAALGKIRKSKSGKRHAPKSDGPKTVKTPGKTSREKRKTTETAVATKKAG